MSIPARPWHLKQAFVLFVLCAVTLPIAVTGMLTFHFVGKKLEQETYRNSASLVHMLQLEVSQFYETTTHRLMQIGDVLYDRKAVVAGNANALLAATAQHAPLFESLFILSETGRVEHLFPFDKEMVGIDFSGRDFFLHLGKEGKTSWNNVTYSLATGAPTFPVAIKYQNKVIVAYIRLAAVTEIFNLIRKMDAGDVIVTDANGTALFHPNPAYVAEQRNLQTLLPIRKALAGEAGAMLSSDEGGEKLTTFAMLEPLHWPVLVQQTTATAFALQQAVASRTLIILLLVTGCVLVGGLVGAIHFGRQIEHLNELISQLSRGSIAADSPPPTIFTEVNDIVNNFIAMAATVRRREEEILDREQRLKMLFDYSPTPIWEEDFAVVKRRFDALRAEGVTDWRRYFDENPAAVNECAGLVRICDVNETSVAFFQAESKESLKRHLTEYFTEESLHVFKEELIALAEGQRAFASEISIRNLQGKQQILWLTLNVIPQSTDTLSHVLVSFSDITDRKQAEAEKQDLQERLQRAEKMEALGQLAGGVAHDLNNVLGILTGYSELLLGEIQEASRSRGYVDKILQSTQKGAAIIEDLLTLARRGVMASEVINLNGTIAGFLNAPAFDRIKEYHPRITFTTACDENLLNIKGSAVHLEKTLMNLVSNAAEAIPGEGRVTIQTENRHLDSPLRGYDEIRAGDYVVLIVSDTGMGIRAEDRDKIFEPFYTKKKMGRSGTGLGLAIVWGTVKDHNGYIDVQSSLGEGTTFTLYFPVSREELTAPQQQIPLEHYLGHGESVLIVDDIADQREIASRLLTKLGYDVYLAASGEEAVACLQERPMDIVVLDMIMTPGIDGLETYQRMLAVSPKQKAIVVSGFTETDRARETQRLGAGAYVKKPYVLERIGIALREVLKKTWPAAD